MTREEEIKERLETHNFSFFDDSQADLHYLLARNEELQREKEKMQAVVDAANRIVADGMLTPDSGTVLVDEPLVAVLNMRLAALDAKEQDDD